jgi:hypothetical protein
MLMKLNSPLIYRKLAILVPWMVQLAQLKKMEDCRRCPPINSAVGIRWNYQTAPFDLKFLRWFVGFSEVAGFFILNLRGVSFKNFQKNYLLTFNGAPLGPINLKNTILKTRLYFIIKHKNPAILHFVRQNLGFGKVLKISLKNGPLVQGGHKQLASGYYYLVANRINILYLIHFYNGNLTLKKSNRAFAKWVKTYNVLYKTNLIILPTISSLIIVFWFFIYWRLYLNSFAGVASVACFVGGQVNKVSEVSEASEASEASEVCPEGAKETNNVSFAGFAVSWCGPRLFKQFGSQGWAAYEKLERMKTRFEIFAVSLKTEGWAHRRSSQSLCFWWCSRSIFQNSKVDGVGYTLQLFAWSLKPYQISTIRYVVKRDFVKTHFFQTSAFIWLFFGIRMGANKLQECFESPAVWTYFWLCGLIEFLLCSFLNYTFSYIQGQQSQWSQRSQRSQWNYRFRPQLEVVGSPGSVLEAPSRRSLRGAPLVADQILNEFLIFNTLQGNLFIYQRLVIVFQDEIYFLIKFFYNYALFFGGFPVSTKWLQFLIHLVVYKGNFYLQFMKAGGLYGGWGLAKNSFIETRPVAIICRCPRGASTSGLGGFQRANFSGSSLKTPTFNRSFANWKFYFFMGPAKRAPTFISLRTLVRFSENWGGGISVRSPRPNPTEQSYKIL